MSPASPGSIDQVIQLAVAPIFLLTGIGAFIGVFAGRLGRIVDRRRTLEVILRTEEHPCTEAIDRELTNLHRRSRLVNAGITSAVDSALLICMLVLIGFVAHFLNTNMTAAIGILFIVALILLIVSLALFLREVFLATRGLALEEDP